MVFTKNSIFFAKIKKTYPRHDERDFINFKKHRSGHSRMSRRMKESL